MEHDAECAQTEVVWHDYLTRSCSLTFMSKHSINFNRMLEERQILLSLQKDLKMREVKMAEEQARVLCSFNVQDLPVELEDLRVRVAGVQDEHDAKDGELLALVVEASNALVDLGILPIPDIPQFPKMAQDVLTAVGVILECM
jgi:hypothetical protein